MEDYIRLNSDFLGQSLQIGSIPITLAAENMWMGRACDYVNHILVLRQDLRQRLNHVFDSLIRGKQAERKQYCFSFHVKTVLVEVGIQEWQIGNAVWNHVDLAARHFEDFLKELR